VSTPTIIDRLRRGRGERAPWIGAAEWQVALWRHPLTDLVYKPWFDRLGLAAIADWYFPVSQAWGLARDPECGVGDFRAVFGDHWPRAQLERALVRAQDRTRRYREAAVDWETGLFGGSAPDPGRGVALEQDRARTAQRYMLGRMAFVPLHARYRFPPVRYDVTPPSEVRVAHATRLAEPAAAFPPPTDVPIEISHPVPARYGEIRWLRFASEVGGGSDTAWARVQHPAGATDPPTVIFAHGICMETEFWRDTMEHANWLLRQGVRVIDPEGPWHGRRLVPGYAGGAPTIAWGPRGLIELFQAWVAEIGRLVAWARATSTGPVMVSGVSLGSLTTEMVLHAASHWPADLQPDAALLLTGSGDLEEVCYESGLLAALGLPAALEDAGWSHADVQAVRPLVEPGGDPGLDPARIVMVLGTEDVVLPYSGGAALAQRWRLPEANLFVRPQGHFSVSLGVLRDPAPLARLLDVAGVPHASA
jgi:hypothetical protein